MPPPASSAPVLSGEGGRTPSPKETNAHRLAVVAEALYRSALSVPCRNATNFRDLSIGLARLIDFAVTNDHKPVNSPRLHQILKQVCQHKSDIALQAAIMVLLISVKNACKIGWFSGKEPGELLCLVDEVSKSFCTPRAAGPDQTSIPSSVSQIMSRFYPWFKLGHIIASLDVKPGFGAYLADFLIPNDLRRNQDEKIRLLVAAVDKIDTSSCIISPTEVDFLVNGIGVDKRNTAFMDLGPQLPTVLDPLLRYGANLLQAVGQFDGHYVILLACMSFAPVHEIPAPVDYDQPSHPVVDTDADIIEGPSQIKLTCPISFGRIACPAKGHMCKHHQCFDFTNYMKINISRPSWRCPSCNQSVCYTDIRIDRSMCEILQAAEENVVEVIISEDGSWKPAPGCNNNIEAGNRSSAPSEEGMGQPEVFLGLSDGLHIIYDLTEGDDHIKYDDDGIVDHKPAVCLPSQITSTPINSTPVVTSTPMNINITPMITSPAMNGTTPQFLTSMMSQSTSSTQAGSAAVGNQVGTSPIFTDSVTPSVNLGQRTSQGTSLPPYIINSGQQLMYGAPHELNGDIPTRYGSHPQPVGAVSGFAVNRYAGHSRNVMPSQSMAMGNNQSQQDNLLRQLHAQSMFQRHPVTPIVGQQTTPVEAPRAPAPHLRNSVNHDRPPIVSAPPYSRGNHDRPSVAGSPLHLRGNHDRPIMASGPSHLRSSRPQVQPNAAWTERMAQSAQQVSTWMRHLQNYPVRVQTPGQESVSSPTSRSMVRPASGEHGPAASGGVVQSVTRMEDLMVGQAEQNQRPSGRMRGSLSIAQVDAGALNQHIIRPTNLGSASAPPSSSNPQSSQKSMAPHLRALMANRNTTPSQPLTGEGGPPATSTGL